jgi:hypothetical protein
VKHVFAETNFIIELVRPLPGPDAQALYERDDVEIHLPWVSVAESKRTLKNKIIRADLGFASLLRKLVAREFREERLSRGDKAIVESLADRVQAEYGEAFGAVERAVDAVVKRLNIIPPSEHVVNSVMKLYDIKSLPPFDEMIMGAVLAKAEELFGCGERDFFFCNLNKRDFYPKENSALAAEYERLTIHYLPSFKVPDQT